MGRRFGVLLALAAAACGGGGGGGGGPGGSGGGTFRATIDGVPWTASAGTVSVSGAATATRPGLLVLSGAEAQSGIALSLALSFIVGPATQPLGVNTGTTPGGTGMIVSAAKSWLTPLDGASGFVTITARTADRLAGTFHFTAAAVAGTGTTPAARSVTDGSFDVTVPGGLPPLPSGVGSTAIATIGGAPWNAATIVGTHPGAGVFGLAADNTAYSISLLPKVPVTAGSTYGIPSQMGMTVVRTGTADAWNGGLGADVGSVTISTFAADRMVATFQATLPALTGSGSLAVTGGAVNAYLQQ